MENKKVTKFTNFNYVVLPITDTKYVDVQVKFKYNGEQALHVISFRKAPGKSNSFYIDKAKTRMAQYEKRGRLEKIATKSISASKDTFYQRHKKGMNALFAVAAVGAVAGGTAAILINCLPKPDPTVVTEEEIDKYLEIPSGKTEFIGAMAGKIIVSQALDNLIKSVQNDGDSVTTNLNHIDVKMISSQSYYLDIGKTNYNPGSPVEPESVPNDLTGFYTNNSFKNKRYYATYIGGNLTKGKTTIDITAKDKLCSTIAGVDSTSNVLTRDLCTYDRTVEGYRSFNYTKFNFDNYSAPNLESYKPMGIYSNKKDVENNYVLQVGKIAREFTMADYLSRFQSYLVKAEDGTVYYAKMEEQQIPLSLPSSIYPDKEEPVFRRGEAIWRFKNTPEFGWVIDSYAQDGFLGDYFNFNGRKDKKDYLASFYVYHNEKGETLEKPFAIHKNKRLIKLNYGEREEVSKEASDVKFKTNNDFLNRYELQSRYFNIDEGTATPVGDPLTGRDMTLIHRIEDRNFDGIDLNGAIYNPEKRITSENEGFICVILDNDTGETIPCDYKEMIKYIKDESAKKLIEAGPTVSFGSNTYTTCKITKIGGWYSVNFILNNKQELDEIKIEWNEGSYEK